jgi:hypothetical protein
MNKSSTLKHVREKAELRRIALQAIVRHPDGLTSDDILKIARTESILSEKFLIRNIGPLMHSLHCKKFLVKSDEFRTSDKYRSLPVFIPVKRIGETDAVNPELNVSERLKSEPQPSIQASTL